MMLCDGGEIQTAAHVLWNCSLLEELRSHIFTLSRKNEEGNTELGDVENVRNELDEFSMMLGILIRLIAVQCGAASDLKKPELYDSIINRSIYRCNCKVLRVSNK